MTTVRRTNRWSGASGLALLVAGVGVVTTTPALVLAAVVGVVYAAYSLTATVPDVTLDVERTVGDREPDAGDDVTVTVTVRNVGDDVLPDLRIVDGVPPALAVNEGSPRLGTALRPGSKATFSYRVTARRGAHQFEPIQVLARDFSGSVERETEVDVETTITCKPPLVATEPVPLRAQTSQYTGHVTTNTGGTGVEFFATREYRPGDSLSRIDWNRHARTGNLATLEFREERAATVVLLVDTRPDAYVAADGRGTHAVEHGVEAAGQTFAALLGGGDRVGLAAFGPNGGWLDPGAGRDHLARARELLATGPGFTPVPSDDPFYPTIALRRLRRRLSGDAQLVLFSPLTDHFMRTMARRLDAYGHAVTVVSPNVTRDVTPGQRLARAERAIGLNELREAGIRVIDWNPDEPLGAALERANAWWSR